MAYVYMVHSPKIKLSDKNHFERILSSLMAGECKQVVFLLDPIKPKKDCFADTKERLGAQHALSGPEFMASPHQVPLVRLILVCTLSAYCS